MQTAKKREYLNHVAIVIAVILLGFFALFMFGEELSGIGILAIGYTLIGVILLRLHMLIWDTNLNTICSGDSPVASILLPIFLWPVTMTAGVLFRVMRFLLNLAD